MANRLLLSVRVLSTAAAIVPVVTVAGLAETGRGPIEAAPIQLRRLEKSAESATKVGPSADSYTRSEPVFRGQSFPARRSLAGMILQRPNPAAIQVSGNPVRLSPEIEPVEFQEEVTTVQELLNEEIPPAPTSNRPPRVEIPYNFLDPADIPKPTTGKSAAQAPSPSADPAPSAGAAVESDRQIPRDCGCPHAPRGLLARPPKLQGVSLQ